MPLDFARIKEIRMVDVCGRYGIQLRFRGDYANAPCPLPTHKDGDKAKSFSINLTGNYWRCFSNSCNANNSGKRGGDCINFVALMENCRERDAAQKLADWYAVEQTKTAPHMEKPSLRTQHQKTYQNGTTSDKTSKYMQEVDAWFEELFKRREDEADIDYWKRCRNGVKAKLVESYKGGKAAKQ